MVDLSKHVERAKNSLGKRQYDLCIQICEDALDIGPAELELHKVLLECARRKQKESGKSWATIAIANIGGTLSFTRDAHKGFQNQLKRIGKGPEPKVLGDVADAAVKYFRSGNKPMAEVATFYYEEVSATGLFLAGPLENAAHFSFERFNETKDVKFLERAIALMTSLERNLPARPDIPQTLKNWVATLSMNTRTDKGGGDFRGQLNSMDATRRAEILAAQVRTPEDAQKVLALLELDLTGDSGQDKAMWIKKGDLERRFVSLAAAKVSFERARALDQHDFTIDKRFDELRIEEAKVKASEAPQDPALKADLLRLEIECFRNWAEKQPMDLSHRYNLGIRLIKAGNIDAAASEFQRSVQDAKLRRGSHRYLGYCFAKKNLLDLACQQYTAYLSLLDDDQNDEAKEVRYARGRLFEDLAKPRDAIPDFERLVTIDMNYKDAAARLTKLRNGP